MSEVIQEVQAPVTVGVMNVVDEDDVSLEQPLGWRAHVVADDRPTDRFWKQPNSAISAIHGERCRQSARLVEQAIIQAFLKTSKHALGIPPQLLAVGEYPPPCMCKPTSTKK